MWAVIRPFVPARTLLVFLAVAVLVTGLNVVSVSDSTAQEQVRRTWILRDLFRPRKSDRVEKVRKPAPKARQKRSSKRSTPRRAQPAQRRAQPKVVVPAVTKDDDALTVMVVGDFLAGGLAEGLTDVFEENPRVKVVDRTRGSSGFVRDDFHDWPGSIVELIETEDPAAIVVMLGANDRQQMVVDGGREEVRSTRWESEYAERTEAMAKAISDRKVPFVWVGVPAFKSPSMTRDMLAFNDFYRAAAEGVGAEFVDIWDGFVDENGTYVSTGPDINGQQVQLRASDGINLTRAGRRKVAFYAEKPLARLLGSAAVPGGEGQASASLPKRDITLPVDIGSIERTVPVSLRDPELDGGTELLGEIVRPKRDPGSPGEKLAIEGVASDPRPGRADWFPWIAGSAPPAPVEKSPFYLPWKPEAVRPEPKRAMAPASASAAAGQSTSAIAN